MRDARVLFAPRMAMLLVIGGSLCDAPTVMAQGEARTALPLAAHEMPAQDAEQARREQGKGKHGKGKHGKGKQDAVAAGFSIEQALSAPFSNGLTAAPARARVAWFTDLEGRRNVWVRDAEEPEPARQVTHYTEDDGQDLDGLAWSDDGEQLAWTRGTGAQGPEHPVANPAELPGPVRQNVEMVDLRADGGRGAVRVVAEGHSPLFLRDGTAILFLRRGNIWIADLKFPLKGKPDSQVSTLEAQAPGEARELPGAEDGPGSVAGVRQLLFVRGTAGGLRLSPDGRMLLFVSGRGDHSFVGVYELATKRLRWMDPGVGLDHDAVWSLDGRRVVFVREVPVISPVAERWMREGAPWSIRVAEMATGEGREVWRADRGAGSIFHGVSAKDELLWMEDESIVFPWERTGFVQMYRLRPEAKGVAERLSSLSVDATRSPKRGDPAEERPDGWEVDAVVSHGGRIVFSANAHAGKASDVDGRHLWGVDVRSSGQGSPKPVTTGDGLQTSPVFLSDGRLAYMDGSATEPYVPVLLGDGRPGGAATRRLAPGLVPKGFPAEQFVTPEAVVFAAADGMRIHGQMFLPRGRKPGEKMPAVVFFHGGPRRQMLLGFHPMEYYARAYEFNQYLASRGFAVLSVNYRSGTGYGLEFRQALHYGADGASEYNDVVGAAKYLLSRGDVDAKRIGAWGGSYGGYLTALALARSSDLYAAGVDLHGVHDWSLELDLWKPTDEPGVDQAAIARRAFASSPMADVGRWRSPVLLIQGDDDRNVLFSQTVRLAAALRAQGVPVEEKVFPDEVHDFLLHRNWVESYRLAADFLERNLGLTGKETR